MYDGVKLFLEIVGWFFVLYLLGYSTFLFISVLTGSMELYKHARRERLKVLLPADDQLPISIIVPAHNEEITAVATVRSLLTLDYRAYEIIVVDDGSTDDTARVLTEAFGLHRIQRPIHRRVPCQREEAVYESRSHKVPLTLICKENGGKADALNMGINASRFPYFICMDADSVLQHDSLRRIIRPVLEDENVVAVGGYERETVGEDMELVVRLHEYCSAHGIGYAIRYASDAVCWTQVPERLGDLCRQRKRWHLGLFQSLSRHRDMFYDRRFGPVGFVSYLYFLIYELLSPLIEIFGVFTMVLAWWLDLINVPFMLLFFGIYAAFGVILTLTVFFSRSLTAETRITLWDGLRAAALCVVELVFLRFVLAWVRCMAFFGYRRKRLQWGQIQRQRIDLN